MLKLCLKFFQFCGLFPLKVGKDKKEKQNSIFFVWSALHLVLIVSFMTYVFVFSDEMLYAETPIGKINDFLVYYSMYFAHLVIVTESFVRRKYFYKFWFYLSKLKRTKKNQIKLQWKKIIVKKVVILVIYTLINESLTITHILSDTQWTNFWYASVFSLCMTRFRHLQHIFFIDIIFFNLKDINRQLRNSVAWTKAVGEEKEISRVFIYQSLKKTKEKFKHLMEMVICVNKIFCWSQAFNFGQHFLEVTSELYWIYAYSFEPNFLWGDEIYTKLNHLKL